MKLLSVAKIADGKTVLMAVLCLRDNVRTDAVETVEILNNAGIQVVMVTGDAEETAVAIAYEPGERAPKILATGKGYLADKIIEKAKEEDVPLYQDNQLANTLSRLEIGDMIPPELYEVVAEILVFVDDMDKLRSKLE